MLKEAIDRIVDLAQRSLAPVELATLTKDDRSRWFATGGQVKQVILKPDVRHSLESLVDLIGYVANDSRDSIRTDRIVFYNEACVMFLPNKYDHRDIIEFSLTPTTQFKKLNELAKALCWYDQRSFIRMLQHELNVDKALLVPWRKLDFRTIAAVSGEVQATKDRMGREISSQVTGAAELPEALSLEFAVFNNPGERAKYLVDCVVEIDAAQQRLALIPEAEGLQLALEAHLGTIFDRLDGDLSEFKMPVFRGTPFTNQP